MATQYKSAIKITAIDKSDHELIYKVANGDIASFEALYQQFGRMLYGYLVRIIFDPYVAEDILQEVFVVVWTGAARFRGHAAVKTWLFQIAHNLAISWVRRQKTVATKEQLLEDYKLDRPEDHYHTQWEHEQIRNALTKLSTEHRAVIQLVFFHGMTYEEVATIMRCPIGTVKSRMSYAKRYLEQYLKSIIG